MRYTDPDGNNIVNNTNKYIIARLEDPKKIRTKSEGKIEIDTVIIPPYSVAYGAFDGARDEDGNYFKVTGKSELISIDFEINEDNDMVIEGFSKWLNDLGDKEKIKKNRTLSDDKKKILSGKKTPLDSDYNELKKSWDKKFINDVGMDGEIGNSETWEKKFYEERQKILRKKIRIRSIAEIREFDQTMHDAHIY